MKLKKNLLENYFELIITALGLVVALSWNSAFQNYFQQNEYLNSYGPWIYAIMLTSIVVVLITFINSVKKRL